MHSTHYQPLTPRLNSVQHIPCIPIPGAQKCESLYFQNRMRRLLFSKTKPSQEE